MLTSGARPSTDERNTRNPTKPRPTDRSATNGAAADRSPARNADGIFNAAFELVATPALFAFFGYLLDGKLHTGRVFTFVFAIVVATYEIWKLWYGYNSRIDELHAEILRPKTDRPTVGQPKTESPAAGDES